MAGAATASDYAAATDVAPRPLDGLAGLNVCFIAGTLGQGGAERQLFYMLRTLAEHGAKPHVLSLMRGEFWEEPIRRLDVPVTWVGRRRSRPARVIAIVDAVRRLKPDVVQSQHFYTNLYAVVAARMAGIREVGAVRCNASWETEELGRFGRASLLMPRVVALNSRAAIANAVALGASPDRLRFVPNVVDTASFLAAPRQAGDTIRVLGIGRRSPQKRFDRFLSVLADVRRRSARSVRGVLVTTGADRASALERRAHELGLGPDAVEFREPVADAAALYRDADIFLLTSDWEGTPNVVLEAMASSLPVVATSVGGVPEMIRHGETGLLADAADEAALADAVVGLVQDDSARSRMGRRARDFIDREHSVRRLPEVLRDFYRTVTT